MKKLIQRQPTPAQSEASRENSLLSTGPRTGRGLEAATANLPEPRVRPFSRTAERTLEALDEDPADFEATQQSLDQAMSPRDGWERAWVQDLAVLRWRLERLHRAESALAALQRRRRDRERSTNAAASLGGPGAELMPLIGLVGFCGIPDSVLKFEQVLEQLRSLRELVEARQFGKDTESVLTLLYGKSVGVKRATLQSQLMILGRAYQEGRFADVDQGARELAAKLDDEIEGYEHLQALYAAEKLEADAVQRDAELLLESEEMERVIRYETHLEAHIDRKLRQFYARRRESIASPLASPADAGTPPRERALARAGHGVEAA